jgi:hypothetical protein
MSVAQGTYIFTFWSEAELLVVFGIQQRVGLSCGDLVRGRGEFR